MPLHRPPLAWLPSIGTLSSRYLTLDCLPTSLSENHTRALDMRPLSIQPRTLRSSGSLLRAGFATKKPRSRLPPPGPRNTVRRAPPSTPPSRRPQSSSRPPPISDPPPETQQSSLDAVSTALRETNSETNNLLSPVNVPEDPNGVLNERHPATSILSNSAIVVTRQLELMNAMLGFEQANKYVIMDPQGNHIGYMAERELGMGNMMARQMFSTHRSFTCHVFDRNENEVLRVCRQYTRASRRSLTVAIVSPAFFLDIEPHWRLRSYRSCKQRPFIVQGLGSYGAWRPYNRSESRNSHDIVIIPLGNADYWGSTATVGSITAKI